MPTGLPPTVYGYPPETSQERRERLREELDYLARSSRPGTPEYASAAIRDLFPRGGADLASTSGLPILSDAADAAILADDLRQGNWGQAGLAAAGMALPFVGAATVKRVLRAAPQDEAMRVAQHNASLPPEMGGLGLPPDNTAMDRAKAMGYDIEAYHGTTYDDVPAFRVSEHDESPITGVAVTPDPEYAGYYTTGDRVSAADEVAPNILPLRIRKIGEPLDTVNDIPFDVVMSDTAMLDWDKTVREYAKAKGTNTVDVLGDDQEVFMLNPVDIRSRFAAFDPFRRDEADLLAKLGLPIGLSGLFGASLYGDQSSDENDL